MDERGTVLLNEDASWLGADDAYVERESQQQLALIRERRIRYRPGRAPTRLTGRTVIVVDD